MAEMRLRFNDAALKNQLQDLAAAVGLSLNELVNKILAAQFSDTEKKSVQLLHDLLEIERNDD